jgi:predicted MFS family arabinose efflux permease
MATPSGIVQAAASSGGSFGGRLVERLTHAIGGPERRRVVIVLGAVISLSAADVGMIGALVPQLESGFHIGNTDIGLLVTVSGLTTALATLPFGVLADRVSRIRLLAWAVLLWGIAELASGLAPSFEVLLFVRLLLGGLTAVAGPTVASLTGDYYAAAERGRMYGYILAGEILGSGFGFVVADLVATWFGWRAALAVLALPSLALWWVLTHRMEEPARGASSPLPRTQGVGDDSEPVGVDVPPAKRRSRLAARLRQQGAAVEENRMPPHPPEEMRPSSAVRFTLRIPTNVMLIVASSLGYFFLNGLRTFAVLFVRGQFGIGQSLATLIVLVVGAGALVGVLSGGRIADRYLDRHLTARLTAAAVGYLVGAVCLLTGLLSGFVGIALPLYVVAGAAIAEPNPPLDAARLDIMVSGLWGRAESVRTLLRGVFEALAPLAFGFTSSALSGGAKPGLGTGVNVSHTVISAARTAALQKTFLIMLVPLVVAGLLMLRARRTYPSDVLTAAEYERRRGQPDAAGRAGT